VELARTDEDGGRFGQQEPATSLHVLQGVTPLLPTFSRTIGRCEPRAEERF
jgi:hypothetical protein